MSNHMYSRHGVQAMSVYKPYVKKVLYADMCMYVYGYRDLPLKLFTAGNLLVSHTWYYMQSRQLGCLGSNM